MRPPSLRHRFRCQVRLASAVGRSCGPSAPARVVEAVNQRGMCAVELGRRLADLPSDEIVSLQSRCGCPSCFQKRAN